MEEQQWHEDATLDSTVESTKVKRFSRSPIRLDKLRDKNKNEIECKKILIPRRPAGGTLER